MTLILYYKIGCYICNIILIARIKTTDMSLGSRLSTIRKELKISQRLAEKAGIHANVPGRYEREEAPRHLLIWPLKLPTF